MIIRQIVLVFLLIASLNIELFAQNIDIHSSDLQKQKHDIISKADSLIGFNVDFALKYCLDEINKLEYFDKPDLYCELLYKAKIAAFHLGYLKQTDSLVDRIQDFSLKNLHPILKANIFLTKAKLVRNSNEKIESIKLSKEALLLYKQNGDIVGEFEANLLISKGYNSMSKNQIALEFVNEAQRIAKNSGFKEQYLLSLILASSIHVDMDQMKSAQDDLTLANEIALGLHSNLALGKVHYALGEFFYHQNNLIKSAEYFDKALNHYALLNHRLRCSDILTFKAAIEMRQEQYDNAVILNHRALVLREEAQTIYLQASSFFNISNSLISLSQFDSALYYINIGERMAKNYLPYKTDIGRSLKLKEKLFTKKNEFKRAYEVLELNTHLNDSLFHLDNKEKLKEMESTFEIDKYEQQAEKIQADARLQQYQSERNESILNIIIIVFILTLIASYLIYINSRNKNNRKILLATQKLIFIQMNSHFVFNALTAIQSLIYKNQIESAIHSLSLFSSLINKVISITHKKYVSIQSEISFIMEFLQIQKLRFGDDLKFQLNIDDDIDLAKIMIPPMLSYPFIEYAVEECVQKSDLEAALIINIRKEGKYLNYEVIDKGLGFLKMEKCFIKRYGGQEIMCEQLTKERISVYNLFYRTRIIFAQKNIQFDGQECQAILFRIKV